MALGIGLVVVVSFVVSLVVVRLALPLLEYRRVRAGVRRRLHTYRRPLESPSAAETARHLAVGELEADAAALRAVRAQTPYGVWALVNLVPSRAKLEEVEGRLEFLASGLEAGDPPAEYEAARTDIETALASRL